MVFGVKNKFAKTCFLLVKRLYFCYTESTFGKNMAHSDTIHQFIQSRPYLVWYVKDLKYLSEDSIVEHTLNYGNWEDFCELVHILGIERIAQDFHRRADLPRTNYRPEIKNFFQLYFDRHAT